DMAGRISSGLLPRARDRFLMVLARFRIIFPVDRLAHADPRACRAPSGIVVAGRQRRRLFRHVLLSTGPGLSRVCGSVHPGPRDSARAPLQAGLVTWSMAG